MNPTNQLQAAVKKEERAIEFVPFGSDKNIKLTVKLITDFLCIPTKKGARCDEREAMKFAMLCQARGLNPWEGDAYLQGYDSQAGPQFSLITAHQAFLKRAELHPEFDGFASGVVVQEEDGSIRDIEGDFFADGQTVIGGWCRVNFKSRKTPMYKRLRLSTFDKGYGVWEKNKEGMIVKCAEADALRASFPTKCGGLYLSGEMPTEEQRFKNAKPANGSTAVDVTPGQIPELTTTPPDSAINAEPLNEVAPTQSEAAETTLQGQLESILRAEGFGLEDFNRWAMDTGNLDVPASSFDALTDEQAGKFVKAKRGLLHSLKAGRQS